MSGRAAVDEPHRGRVGTDGDVQAARWVYPLDGTRRRYGHQPTPSPRPSARDVLAAAGGAGWADPAGRVLREVRVQPARADAARLSGMRGGVQTESAGGV